MTLEERVTELEEKLDKLMVWTTNKLKDKTPPKGFTIKYTEEESERLLKACEGTEEIKGKTAKVCAQLIEDGWNEDFSTTRSVSALRTKYLRLIGLK